MRGKMVSGEMVRTPYATCTTDPNYMSSKEVAGCYFQPARCMKNPAQETGGGWCPFCYYITAGKDDDTAKSCFCMLWFGVVPMCCCCCNGPCRMSCCCSDDMYLERTGPNSFDVEDGGWCSNACAPDGFTFEKGTRKMLAPDGDNCSTPAWNVCCC